MIRSIGKVDGKSFDRPWTSIVPLRLCNTTSITASKKREKRKRAGWHKRTRNSALRRSQELLHRIEFRVQKTSRFSEENRDAWRNRSVKPSCRLLARSLFHDRPRTNLKSRSTFSAWYITLSTLVSRVYYTRRARITRDEGVCGRATQKENLSRKSEIFLR